MTDSFSRELVALLPRLHRFALGLTTDHDSAADLVQAACERALTRRCQWQEGTRLDSWMYKITQNLWIDHLRSAGHALDELDDNLPGVDSAAQMEDRASLEQVLSAMARLAPNMRAVLALVCLQEMSYKETASILDIPLGTVMSRLARGRLRLNELLTQEGLA